ncbi:1-deoxy-D-xylulose-5-phosphate reductoisomerase [Candidatus Pelagibacter giovannonii]|uniref:1-deoxy-D-xylulose 5-phosphate reductoisomerase n=1 Tax=Candidatus Pelagibacter giovannonii TaxID=2563896 RepID=A0A6H1Q0V3_9PROT|nr:1-deoxy-D-xylulose-5-phosphate reductoisomerase [Candidatus Pelagibacter giovannonii]QIZ20448.1 1-deoxy-D-xylulose-5-phosphate reductoisomerase [Candidatus Pelagibacter giovannonii]
MKKIAIFGSTGSVGSSLLRIIKDDRKNFKIELLAANKNYKKLIKQAKFFNVKNIILTDYNSYLIATKLLKNTKVKVFKNFDSLNKIFDINKKIDYTMCAISGFQGLRPTLDIIKFTKTIAIANKESIICGWNLIKKDLNKYKTFFIPVDSEHFSIWSLLDNNKNDNLEKIYITASGGPFRKLSLKKFKNISIKDALKHPNWSMGKKITIDSATMMNKVFEIIEAKKIFNLDYSQLEILTHPKSYLHAIVKFNNGLSKLLVHDTNMIIPIFNSIYFNTNKKLKSKNIDIETLNNLNLKKIDNIRFPIIKILNNLSNEDSLFETIIVSANDKLVKLFLNNKIKFTDISNILLKISNTTEFKKFRSIKPRNIEEINNLSNYVSLKIDTMSV